MWVGGKIPLYANFIGVQGVNHMIEVFQTLNSFSQDGSTTNTESHCVVVLVVVVVVVVVDLLTRSPTKITTQRESGDSSIEFWELGS